MKKALVTMQDFDGPAKQQKTPYPTGETPGRGDFNLAVYLFEHSAVDKEDYNMFIVRNSCIFDSHSLTNRNLTHTGIDPSGNDRCRYPKHGSLARRPGGASFGCP